jgi:predicted AAA+ superfamily ATPase
MIFVIIKDVKNTGILMKDEILKAIGEWNPWFEGRFPDELRGYARDYSILEYLKMDEIKVLEGARRVGKSTLMYQVIEQLLAQNHKVLYLNFDDEELRKYSLKTIVHSYLEVDSFDCLFLDEIQHCSEWVHYIRNAYDRKEIKQIWISGSNSSFIKTEYKTLLSGRNITIQIHPLSFHEYLTFKQCDVPTKIMSSQKEIAIKSHLKNYLKFGAFPAITLRDIFQKELLINYFEDFLYKDIATRYSVNNSKLKDLGIYLATNSAKIVSYRNIANALGVHVNTITDYFSYFKEIFLFSEIYKFDYSLKEQFGKDKKIYCLDTGLAAAVSFLFSDDKGRMLENLVYNELCRRKFEIYFHRGKKECDFIVKQNLDIIQVIQVCYLLIDKETKERELKGLADALEIYPHAEGILITADEAGEEEIQVAGKNRRIKILPIWKWLLDL